MTGVEQGHDQSILHAFSDASTSGVIHGILSRGLASMTDVIHDQRHVQLSHASTKESSGIHFRQYFFWQYFVLISFLFLVSYAYDTTALERVILLYVFIALLDSGWDLDGFGTRVAFYENIQSTVSPSHGLTANRRRVVGTNMK